MPSSYNITKLNSGKPWLWLYVQLTDIVNFQCDAKQLAIFNDISWEEVIDSWWNIKTVSDPAAWWHIYVSLGLVIIDSGDGVCLAP